MSEIQVQKTETNTVHYVVGDKESYHGYVTKQEGSLRVSMYRGQKQMMLGLSVEPLESIKAIVDQMIELAKE